MDRGKVIKALNMHFRKTCKNGDCPYATVGDCEGKLLFDVLALLQEQEAEIRQLRLALDIAKGTCKGIAFETDEKFMGDL